MSVDPMKALRDRKSEILDELARIERAMLALSGDPSAAAAPTAARAAKKKRLGSTKPRRGPKPSSTSVKTRVGKLLAAEDRKWRVNDILQEFRARGEPLTAASPKDATRTALANLMNLGDVVRVEEGLYTHSRWLNQPAPNQLDGLLDEQEGM